MFNTFLDRSGENQGQILLLVCSWWLRDNYSH